MNILDKNLELSNDDKNTIRLFSSIILIGLFLFFVLRGGNNKTLLLYIGLIWGRFVFFDTLMGQIVQSLKGFWDCRKYCISCIISIIPLIVYMLGIHLYNNANQFLMLSFLVIGYILTTLLNEFYYLIQ